MLTNRRGGARSAAPILAAVSLGLAFAGHKTVSAQSQPMYALVFFQSKSAALTPEASQVLQMTVKNIAERHPTNIRVTGHTDTVGTPAENQALSERRAAAVKSFFVNAGIAAASISVSGEGENSAMVQTNDEIREPQNNRVEVAY